MPRSKAVFSMFYQKVKEEKLSGADDDDDDDDEQKPSVRCTYCCREERVVDFDDLKRGDHIRMGGRHFMFNINDSQVTLYKHHAIVKEVKKLDKNNGIATLVHFYTLSFDDKVKIQETEHKIDLEYYELYKVRYAHGTISPDTIIDRATSLTKSDKSWTPFSCNCEHFSHWCCIGNAESYQVNDLFSVLRQIATGTLTVLGKVSNVILLALDKTATVGLGACSILVPWGTLGVMAVAYLIYCIYRHTCLNKDKALGQICTRCCRREKKDMWLKFFVCCATQVGGVGLLSVVIAAGASHGIVFAATAVMVIISIALMWGIPKLRNALCSPFEGKTIKVKSTDNIWIGDVIAFKYKLHMHYGIVSKLDKINHKKARLSVIHYSVPSVFGRRVIQEETHEFDLTRDKIMGHDYSSYDVHPPEMVVQRARQRLGETKFGVFSNRSCHFCHWAKVNEDIEDAPEETAGPMPVMLFERSIRMGEDISGLQKIDVDHRSNRKHSTKTMGKVCARIPQEVKEGSIIQFKYGTLRRWHYAVTTEVHHTTEPSLKLSVTVVHYGEGSRPCEERFDFDLRHDDIYIDRYHPLSRYSRKDVVRRARERIGKGKYHVIKHRSSHLAKEIVEKNRDELVTNFDMVGKGDVIIFYYWSLKHAAILVNVGKGRSKANNRADVTVIHYALKNLLGKMKIKQEVIPMDLSRDHVYRRRYAVDTYPADLVVRRAKRRVGEKLFSIHGNTSWDLVHWAKVIQTPAIVKMSFDEVDAATARVPDREERIVLLPEVGKVTGNFQKVRVHTWRDLQPGIIIEYVYYWIPHQAILVDVDYKAKKITVIHYGTNTIFSTRTIMMDTFRVDPKRDELWMYRCNPNVCNPPMLIVTKAVKRLGEKKWGRDNTSWDFCKACVVKQRTRSLENLKSSQH